MYVEIISRAGALMLVVIGCCQWWYGEGGKRKFSHPHLPFYLSCVDVFIGESFLPYMLSLPPYSIMHLSIHACDFNFVQVHRQLLAVAGTFSKDKLISNVDLIELARHMNKKHHVSLNQVTTLVYIA